MPHETHVRKPVRARAGLVELVRGKGARATDGERAVGRQRAVIDAGAVEGGRCVAVDGCAFATPAAGTTSAKTSSRPLFIECTGCPHFGLLAGQSINLHSLGPTGRLASTASRVGEALHDLTTYFVLHESGGVTHLAVSNGTATFSCGIQAAIRHTDQACDIAAVVLLNVMRQLCGPGWQPGAVLLPRRRPEDVRPYREALQAPIRFDSVQASVQFPTEWLDRPVVGSDPLRHAALQEHVAAASDRTDPLLENEVRRAIRRSLTSGRISRESIARQLGLHPRTLVRRLTENGLSFQALLDETRALVAPQLLRDTRVRVSRIATSLGYRDPTVFSRAFRGWTGHTPRAFREALPRNG